MSLISNSQIHILCIVTTVLLCIPLDMTVQSHTNEINTDMGKITFIPAEFNNVKLGYYQNSMTPCTPRYPDDRMHVNTISVNAPQKIILDTCTDNLPAIMPMCAVFSISSRRSLKYHVLSAKIVSIRNIDNDIVYTGEITESYMEHRIDLGKRRPDYEERLLEAKNFSDDELNVGQASGGYMNLNAMEYVNMPFSPGKYEVWLSFYGLESNHCIVEIVVAE